MGFRREIRFRARGTYKCTNVLRYTAYGTWKTRVYLLEDRDDATDNIARYRNLSRRLVSRIPAHERRPRRRYKTR